MTLLQDNHAAKSRGHGSCYGHHGELLQGTFNTGEGLLRGLVTLRCTLFASQAVLEPAVGAPLKVQPAWKRKARDAARFALDSFDLQHFGGTLRLSSNVGVGCGFGSSTSDVTAAIRSVFDLVGVEPRPDVTGAIAVTTEGASDPIMYPTTVLFAHRAGVLIDDYQMPLPSLAVLGFGLGTAPVDTVQHPAARYSLTEIAEFDTLRRLMHTAMKSGDASLVGAISTASATLNQRFLATPRFGILADLAQSYGVGLQVAHSGNIAGVIFDRNDPDFAECLREARRRILSLGFARTWCFAEPPTTITRPRQAMEFIR